MSLGPNMNGRVLALNMEQRRRGSEAAAERAMSICDLIFDNSRISSGIEGSRPS
jgi:hypothetical protein